MSILNYYIIPENIKELSKDIALPALEEAQDITLEELKNSSNFGGGDSVMTVCENFITIYGYPTWFKKFGR